MGIRQTEKNRDSEGLGSHRELWHCSRRDSPHNAAGFWESTRNHVDCWSPRTDVRACDPEGHRMVKFSLGYPQLHRIESFGESERGSPFGNDVMHGPMINLRVCSQGTSNPRISHYQWCINFGGWQKCADANGTDGSDLVLYRKGRIAVY